MKISKRYAWALVSLLGPLLLVVYQNTAAPVNMRASLIFTRLTGKPPTAVQLEQMQSYLDQGQVDKALSTAVNDPDFLNTLVRNSFCAPMSVRAMTPETPFNDFTATCMGMIRDDVPATDMLVGNFVYRIDAKRVPASLGLKLVDATDPANTQQVFGGNNHYKAVSGAEFLFDLASALYKDAPQKIPNPGFKTGDTYQVFENPDPAGLITSQTFMSEECSAGTNRRCVEYVFRTFLCRGPTEFADNGLASGGGDDSWVGPDVDRFPGGEHATYEQSCKSCHNIMDAARGAFAYYDYRNGVGVIYTPGVVANKYTRNSNVFASGHMTLDDSWTNNALYGNNETYFGWKGSLSGRGLHSFAQMVSQSRAFSECMVKRVVKAVCLREPNFDDLTNIVVPEAEKFKSDNYNFKNLFGRVAANPNCIGPVFN